MDKKFLVPFKTAQQLKEKGYPQEGATMYYDTFSGGEISLITDRECVSCVVDGNDRHPLFKRLSELYIAAPTYHEVLDWLDSQGIYINCFAPTRKRDVGRYISSFYNNNTGYWSTCKYNSTTREGALNMAIIAALEML